jgi:hypothetical protein
VALYELTKIAINALDQTTFAMQDINERFDLQRLLRQNIEVIASDTLVIAEEFCEWDESKRRVDLLGVDRDANLVVIELKRTEDGGHMELQAIRYAAMVSAMSFSKAVEAYSRYLERHELKDDAETALLQFLNWDAANEETFGQDVRIVLVSAEFSKEITTSVLWLNEHAVDIRCVRLRPYALENRVLLDVQQVIPLPEADSYTVQLKKKAEENRQAKRFEFDFSKYDLMVDGTRLPQLTKRRLVLEVVKAAIAKGLPPEQIGAMVPPNKWISVDGEVAADEFQEKASRMQAKLGGKYNLRRYFCEDGELFHITGRTYALSNQWSVNTISIVDELIAKLPPGSLSYAKSDNGA